MATFKRVEEFDTWQKAQALAQEIEELSERAGLGIQAGRAAHQAVTKITEGFEREDDKAFRRILGRANKSVDEALRHLQKARATDRLQEHEHEPIVRQAGEVKALIQGLIRYLSQSGKRRSRGEHQS